MSSSFPRAERSAGFTLPEVLVALAIAAMLVAMLVRFVAGTRANAGRIGEALQMATIAEGLLARLFTDEKSGPGRMDGRTGEFVWRVEVQPTPFAAVARRLHEPPAPATAEGGSKTQLLEPARASMRSAGQSVRLSSSPGRNWTALRVVITVKAPSGRQHVADVVKFRP